MAFMLLLHWYPLSLGQIHKDTFLCYFSNQAETQSSIFNTEMGSKRGVNSMKSSKTCHFALSLLIFFFSKRVATKTAKVQVLSNKSDQHWFNSIIECWMFQQVWQTLTIWNQKTVTDSCSSCCCFEKKHFLFFFTGMSETVWECLFFENLKLFDTILHLK